MLMNPGTLSYMSIIENLVDRIESFQDVLITPMQFFSIINSIRLFQHS